MKPEADVIHSLFGVLQKEFEEPRTHEEHQEDWSLCPWCLCGSPCPSISDPSAKARGFPHIQCCIFRKFRGSIPLVAASGRARFISGPLFSQKVRQSFASCDFRFVGVRAVRPPSPALSPRKGGWRESV